MDSKVRNSGLDGKEFSRAKDTAYRFLAFRPRSCSEVMGKLRDKGFAVAVSEAVLDHLERLGYVNDRRFAEQWAASRMRLRSFGRRRIEQELRHKGVARETIAEALAGVLSACTELETARKLAEKKLITMKSSERGTIRRRLAELLGRKGFSSDIIGDVLRDIGRTHAPLREKGEPCFE